MRTTRRWARHERRPQRPPRPCPDRACSAASTTGMVLRCWRSSTSTSSRASGGRAELARMCSGQATPRVARTGRPHAEGRQRQRRRQALAAVCAEMEAPRPTGAAPRGRPAHRRNSTSEFAACPLRPCRPLPRGREMRILIADDDATSRLLLKAIVTKLGHECLVAEDGSGAWDLLASGGIDVLLTDWMMPGVDGPELCRRVRERAGRQLRLHRPDHGARDHPEHVLEGMSAGADDYLIKPVDPFAVQTRLVAAERVTDAAPHTEPDSRRSSNGPTSSCWSSRSPMPLTGLGNRRRMEEDLVRTHARALPCRALLRRWRSSTSTISSPTTTTTGTSPATRPSDTSRADRRRRSCGRVCLPVWRRGVPAPAAGLRPADSVAAIGERIRQTVMDAAIPHGARPSRPPFVTLSGGVA